MKRGSSSDGDGGASSGNVVARSAVYGHSHGHGEQALADPSGECGSARQAVLDRGFVSFESYADCGFKACSAVAAAGGVAYGDYGVGLGDLGNENGRSSRARVAGGVVYNAYLEPCIEGGIRSHRRVAGGVAYNGYPEPSVEGGLRSYGRVNALAAPIYAVQDTTMSFNVNCSSNDNPKISKQDPWGIRAHGEQSYGYQTWAAWSDLGSSDIKGIDEYA